MLLLKFPKTKDEEWKANNGNEKKTKAFSQRDLLIDRTRCPIANASTRSATNPPRQSKTRARLRRGRLTVEIVSIATHYIPISAKQKAPEQGAFCDHWNI
jgi:hypothetical protein